MRYGSSSIRFCRRSAYASGQPFGARRLGGPLDAVVLDVLRRCYNGFDGDAETTHNSYRLDLNQIIPSKSITEEV